MEAREAREALEAREAREAVRVPPPGARFARPLELGQIVATRGAIAAFERAGEGPFYMLRRHMLGDGGELCAEDAAANVYASEHGLRILSAYRTNKGDRLWIITEADRSVTTILLPEEY